MQLIPLSSGSKGNATLIETDDCRVLIDTGLSGKHLQSRMAEFDIHPESIDALFITHEHSDHVGGAGVCARKFGIPVHIREATYRRSHSRIFTGHETIHPLYDDVTIGQTVIRAVPVSHDAADPVAYKITHGQTSVAIATDMGVATHLVKHHLKNCDAYLLEMNHDPARLKANRKYPWPVKQRILSAVGHLSNEAGAELFMELAGERTKKVYLAHLSEENNDPMFAMEELERIAGRHPRYADIDIAIAYQHRVSDPVTV